MITLNHQLYFIYSGWPLENPNGSDLIQQLFIVGMDDPVTANSPPTLLCAPDEPWERTGDHGINEGAQVLESEDGEWKGIIYSCGGSWSSEYKMNTIRYLGGDPLDVKSWQKGTKPLIQTANHDKGPWGPGHGSIITIEGQLVCIYHATDNKNDGWVNRKARMQRVLFTKDGPHMGEYVGPLTRDWDLWLGKSSNQTQHEEKSKGGLKGALSSLKDRLK